MTMHLEYKYRKVVQENDMWFMIQMRYTMAVSFVDIYFQKKYLNVLDILVLIRGAIKNIDTINKILINFQI